MFARRSLPRQVRSEDARPETLLGPTRASNRREHIVPQFRPIMGRGTGGGFVDLGPHEFCRVELGCAGWKRIHMQARMAR